MSFSVDKINTFIYFLFLFLFMLNKLTDKEKIEIYSNIINGQYSKEVTIDSLEHTFEQLGLKLSIKNTLTTSQMQVVDNLLNILIKKIK